MKALFAILVVLLSASLAVAEDRYVSEALGYEISTPEPSTATGAMYQHVMFYLPPTDGFGANVNVQLQDFPGTLQEYEKLSKDQFQKAGIEVLISELKNDALTFEYSGKLQNYQLHWYARALKKGSKVYLVTATGLESHWKTQSTALIKSVKSFKLR